MLLRPRRDLDPRLGAHRHVRVVRLGAFAVVPVRLWRSRWLDVHGWLLHDDRCRVVGVVGVVGIVRRRVIPPVRAPAAPAVAPEPMMMTEAVAPVAPVPAAVPAVSASAPCMARHCGNEQECNREEGNRRDPSHVYLTTLEG